MTKATNDRPDGLGEPLERIAAALDGGIILADAAGQTVWLDERARRRLNGDSHSLALPTESGSATLQCSVRVVETTVGGKPVLFAVLQEAGEQPQTGRDFVATLEAVMADTSWFTRTIIEKFKALRPGAQPIAPPDGLDLLSDREREVLGLICEGRSDAEMSRMLNLSQNTVRNHIASLYRKIGVNRRGAAIIWARERAITGHSAGAARQSRRRQVHDAK
jgi:DNA-binding CsgD family transcriptional regulator